jgi:hypothetical protein
MRKNANRARPKKYSDLATAAPPQSGLEQLSESEARQLTRLIRKHGKKVVVTAVGEIRLREPRKRGRPSRGNLPHFELMHLASFLDELTHEYRAAGSKAPFVEAVTFLYELKYDVLAQADKPRFQRFINHMRRQRRRGLRKLKELRTKLDAFKGGGK